MRYLILILLTTSFLCSACYGLNIQTLKKSAMKQYKLIEGSKKKREKADPTSIVLLANLYTVGYGDLKQSDEKAIYWFREAMKTDSLAAIMEMATITRYGLYGVPADAKKAFSLYMRAAKKGYGPAQNELAFLYFKGEGVPQSDTLAYVWWGLAAASRTPFAVSYKQSMAKEMTSKQLREADLLVIRYARRYGYGN